MQVSSRNQRSTSTAWSKQEAPLGDEQLDQLCGGVGGYVKRGRVGDHAESSRFVVSSLGKTDPESQDPAPHAATQLVRRRLAASAPQVSLRRQFIEKTSLKIARETTRGVHQPLRASARARPRPPE